MEAETGVGDDVDPRSGRHLSWTQERDVFPSVCRESSKPVEEFEILRDGSARHCLGLRAASRSSEGTRNIYRTATEEPRARLLGEQIRAQQEHRATGVVGTGLWLRLTHSQLCLQGRL